MEEKEIKIPVPWGHIAAKTWGNSDNELVLAVHGWMDNASTFDNLIPLLSKTFYYVCIDLPSHGFSSRLEASIFVHFIDYVPILKLILDHINRKCILLGHSLGGFISILFTQLYPNYISKLIIFDVYYFYPASASFHAYLFKRNIAMYQKFLKRIDRPITYTYEEATKKLMLNRLTPISKESAEILMKRAVVPAEDGKYKFKAGGHVLYLMRPPYPLPFIQDMVEKFPITCPHLFIISSSSAHLRIIFKKVHNEYAKNKHFEHYEIEGTHDLHLEHPERISDIVTRFLQKSVSKL